MEYMNNEIINGDSDKNLGLIIIYGLGSIFYI